MLQISSSGPEGNTFALNNALTLLEESESEKRSLDLRIVVFGKGVANFVRPIIPALKDLIDKLHQKPGVHLIVSEKSMTHFHLKRSELLPGFEVVPSGAFEVVRLQEAGYIYFSP